MQRRAILYNSAIDDPAPWKKAFAERRSDLDFRIWPDVGDANDIRYALIWSTKDGFLRSLPNLEAIFSMGAGVDQILRDTQFPKHIPLFRLVDAGLKEQMSEYVIYGVLRWHRRMARYEEQQKAHKWQMLDAVHPSERTIGVMGLGVFGSDAAIKLATLGFRVFGWSRTPKVIPNVRCFAGAEEFDAFLAETEILVNLLPLTKETHGLLNARLLEKLPHGAALIHLGRGAHLNEADLAAAIERGHIGWAMLDVYPTEPLPPDHPFWSNSAVFVTPHVAAQPVSDVALNFVLSNLSRFERGEEPLGRVDPNVGY
ncbi:MAG: 2-hydroxyacid dehydrogenase [Hyphomicrobiales bacterium]